MKLKKIKKKTAPKKRPKHIGLDNNKNQK